MNRIGFLGGSDMRRIMDGDWVSLWEQKTARSELDDLSTNLAVQLGIHTESFNIEWFKDNLQAEVTHEQHEFTLNWYNIPLKGQVDGMLKLQDPNDKINILECKHTYEMNKMESCIKMYMPQMQFYMWLAQADGCYLSVIFGNRRWECVYVSKDWDYIEKMKVYIKEFWGHVTEDTRPFGDNEIPPVSIDKIKVDGMTKRDASGDNEFISRCHDYIEQEKSAKLFESAKSDLKAMVGDDEREVYCDLLAIKRDKRGSLRITVKEN
jgi:hypothetical protein